MKAIHPHPTLRYLLIILSILWLVPSLHAYPHAIEIESFTFDQESVVPGQSLTAEVSIRNSSAETIEQLRVQFYIHKQPIGSVIEMKDIAANSRVHASLPFRPRGLGTYPINVVVSQDQNTQLTLDESSLSTRFQTLSKTSTLYIAQNPAWWGQLSQVLQDADRGLSSIGHSAMAGLENHSLCKNDIQRDHTLHKYGQAMIDALAIESNNKPGAQLRYADGLNQLAKFAEMLYCIDLTQLQYWDRAIAHFWKNSANHPSSAISFDDAILATLNPALLVVDAIQFTGYSEIIETFLALQPRIQKALTRYPVDSYGAAWLDGFGSGKLVSLVGQNSLDNLANTLAQPVLLGLGTCSLASHAGKTTPNQACFANLERVSSSCNSAGLTDFLAELNEANLLLPLVEGNLARKSNAQSSTAGGGGTPPSAALSPGVSVEEQSLSYFGMPAFSYATQLCQQLQFMKPRGLQGLAVRLGEPFANLDGCSLAMLSENLHGPGGTSGGQALQCVEQRSSLIPSPFQATQVKFPVTQCGYGRPEQPKGRMSFKEVLKGLSNLRTNKEKIRYERMNGGARITLRNKTTGGVEADFRFDSNFKNSMTIAHQRDTGGKIIGTTVESYRKDGQLSTVERTRYHKDGSYTVSTTEYGDNGQKKLTHTQSFDKNDKKKGNPHTRFHTPFVTTAGSGKPTEGDATGCGESATQQRARAMYNCLFQNPSINLAGTPLPVSLPLEFGTSLPSACNAIDPQRLWGSSTGDGVYDPPRLRVSGGPMIYRRFIPEIDGVIDPPKMLPAAGVKPE